MYVYKCVYLYMFVHLSHRHICTCLDPLPCRALSREPTRQRRLSSSHAMGIERILASSERDFVAKSVDYIEAARIAQVFFS